MSTYTQILFQIVFSTKNRERTLKTEKRVELYKYIWGIMKNKKCHLYQIGGIEDHIHIVTHIHPTISLSALIKDIKVASIEYIKKESLFQNFTGWQDGYAAFTYSLSEKDKLVSYVKNQEEHHKVITYHEELKQLLIEQKIEFDEKYLL
ncbi:MAG: IS200/IS605 family transposase [Bacteroidota bacterium]